MLTFAVLSFAVVFVRVLFGGMTFDISGKIITFGEMDAATIGAFLTPTLGAYVGRRWTDTPDTVVKVPPVDEAQPSDRIEE